MRCLAKGFSCDFTGGNDDAEEKGDCRADLRHVGMYLLRSGRLADDLWKYGTSGDSLLADRRRGADQCMEKYTGDGACLSGNCTIWDRAFLSGKLYKEKRKQKNLPHIDDIRTDALDVPALILHYDFLSVRMDEPERLCGCGAARGGGTIFASLVDCDRQ